MCSAVKYVKYADYKFKFFFWRGGGWSWQAGSLAMNSVFWDVLLCDLVEIYQYFVEGLQC